MLSKNASEESKINAVKLFLTEFMGDPMGLPTPKNLNVAYSEMDAVSKRQLVAIFDAVADGSFVGTSTGDMAFQSENERRLRSAYSYS